MCSPNGTSTQTSNQKSNDGMFSGILSPKEMHRTRNIFNEKMGNVTDAIDNKGWKALGYEKNAFHRQGPGNENNIKLVSPDGKSEVIIRPDATLVTDERNRGTFNFIPEEESKIGHTFVDIAPYLIWGNSPDDPSTISERSRLAANGVAGLFQNDDE
jgi:hypothetical protein